MKAFVPGRRKVALVWAGGMAMFLWIGSGVCGTDKTGTALPPEIPATDGGVEKEIEELVTEIEIACMKDTMLVECIRNRRIHKASMRLQEIGSPGVPRLLEVFQEKNRDWKLRYFVLKILGKTGDAQVVETFIKLAEDKSENDELRETIVSYGMKDFKDERVTESLFRTLNDKNNPAKVRVAVVNLLSDRPSERFFEALIAASTDKDEKVRIAVIHGLVKAEVSVEEKRVVEVILQIAENDKSKNVREHAVTVLGKLKTDTALPALVRILRKDEFWRVRADAARALGDFRGKEATDALIQALKDKKNVVQQQAAKALARIGDRSAISHLKEAINNAKDPVTRKMLQKCLRQLEPLKENKSAR
jgi:HEAT repeat protein